MAKRKQPPSVGDLGPDGPAAVAGTTVHEIARQGRSPVRRRFRDHLLEIMAKPRVYKSTTSPPLITGRQRDAGIELYKAWCETGRSPEKTGVYVDNTPDWAAIALQQIERKVAWAAVSALIPDDCRDVVLNVVVRQFPIYHNATAQEGRVRLETLRRGLDSVASGLRVGG